MVRSTVVFLATRPGNLVGFDTVSSGISRTPKIGRPGRQYINETTLELVHQRLLAQFDHLQTSGHDSIAGMIKQCAETSLKLFQELENDEVDSEDDEEGDSEDDDSEISDGTDLEGAPPEDVEEP
ncbi:hypothetical protein IV203_034242 [Nitzschia inconspicua]|uniref:Uncharacterized protein n=1 Tax=Nitzschia inconspicua TaxID=303405 RepID=A0A9K3M4E9_9STRA|nr:hypothetical protein IV203_034242 [Nitzschia inconspicua]